MLYAEYKEVLNKNFLFLLLTQLIMVIFTSSVFCFNAQKVLSSTVGETDQSVIYMPQAFFHLYWQKNVH